MQKFTRFAIVLLLIMVAIAIVGSQTQLYQKGYVGLSMPKLSGQVQSSSPATGEQAAPEAAVAVPVEEVKAVQAEREKDRDIQRGNQKELAKLAASSMAQNFLLLFQAIIYFLILVIIYSMLETVKKFADAAIRSAEAARISAESASRGGHGGNGSRRFEGNKFIMRRLRGNWQKK